MLDVVNPNSGRLWLLDVVGGLALLAGAATPWIRHGPGRTLRGLDLADQLIGGQLAPSWGRTVGLALYVCVATGAVLLASSAVRGPRVDTIRLCVSVSLLMAALVIVVLSWFPLALWGPAPVLAVCGLSASLAANLEGRLRRRGAQPLRGFT